MGLMTTVYDEWNWIPFFGSQFQTDEHCNHGRKKVHPDDLNLDDYHPIDPVPSSKTSVKPGPIEHGAPLLPHMPNPPPPSQPGGYA